MTPEQLKHRKEYKAAWQKDNKEYQAKQKSIERKTTEQVEEHY
jgi:hypothetical protein